MQVSVTPRSDRPGRRATSKRINYSGLLASEGDESNEDDQLIFKDNEADKNTQNMAKIAIDDDSDVISGSDSSPNKNLSKRSHKKAISASDSEDDKKVNAAHTVRKK